MMLELCLNCKMVWFCLFFVLISACGKVKHNRMSFYWTALHCSYFLCVLWSGLPSVECFELLSSEYVCLRLDPLCLPTQNISKQQNTEGCSVIFPNWSTLDPISGYFRNSLIIHDSQEQVIEKVTANEQGISRTQINALFAARDKTLECNQKMDRSSHSEPKPCCSKSDGGSGGKSTVGVFKYNGRSIASGFNTTEWQFQRKS